MEEVDAARGVPVSQGRVRSVGNISPLRHCPPPSRPPAHPAILRRALRSALPKLGHALPSGGARGAGEPAAAGVNGSVTLDVRVIAATHRDLEAGVERGTFREDFYYRLWWAVLEVPPLHERREDIPLLVEHFRGEVNDGLGLDITGVSREAMAILEGDDWPRNVRELEAVVKRAMVRRRAGRVTPEDIVLPRLRRDRLPGAMRAPGIHLTPFQEQALQLKAAHGEVRRADLIARCRVSHEVARRALAGLARLGLLRRVGLGRATRYVSLSFWLMLVDDAVELVVGLV